MDAEVSALMSAADKAIWNSADLFSSDELSRHIFQDVPLVPAEHSPPPDHMTHHPPTQPTYTYPSHKTPPPFPTAFHPPALTSLLFLLYLLQTAFLLPKDYYLFPARIDLLHILHPPSPPVLPSQYLLEFSITRDLLHKLPLILPDLQDLLIRPNPQLLGAGDPTIVLGSQRKQKKSLS
jgi:hypothetical protein